MYENVFHFQKCVFFRFILLKYFVLHSFVWILHEKHSETIQRSAMPFTIAAISPFAHIVMFCRGVHKQILSSSKATGHWLPLGVETFEHWLLRYKFCTINSTVTYSIRYEAIKSLLNAENYNQIVNWKAKIVNNSNCC